MKLIDYILDVHEVVMDAPLLNGHTFDSLKQLSKGPKHMRLIGLMSATF
jgi:hypothetical protein